MSRWFRFYDEALNDPKVQRLPPHLFKAWVNLLCLASKMGGRIPIDDDVAFQLRLSIQDAAQQVDELILAGLIDIGADGSRMPHNWSARQYASDTSAERMRKHRKSKKKIGDGESDVTRDVTVTVQNRTDSESEDNNLALPLCRAREKGNEQGFDFGFLRKGKKGRGDSLELLRQRAEGFGLPASDLLMAATAPGIKNQSAYFTSLAVTRLKAQLPIFNEQLLRDALWGKDHAIALVYSALTEGV